MGYALHFGSVVMGLQPTLQTTGRSLTLLGLTTCLWVGGIGPSVRAELPPGSYDRLRAVAPEALVIEVVNVGRKLGDQGRTAVIMQAKVLTVERSKTGLKKGDIISIHYTRIEQLGVVGPRQVPLLEKGGIYPAFLQKGDKDKVYEPTAYGESFKMTPEG